MIVIDTNVISELWKTQPDLNVLAWVDAQAINTLYLSAVTVAELRYGIAAMPKGKRQTIYQKRLETEVLPAFSGRILAFDLEASAVYAELLIRAKKKGKAIALADAYIAATAVVYGFIVATRDTSPFQAAEVEVLNPWKTKS